MRGEVSGSHHVEHRQIVNEKTLFVAARDQGVRGPSKGCVIFSLKLKIVSEKKDEGEAGHLKVAFFLHVYVWLGGLVATPHTQFLV
jgi:hypothetical protein